MRTYITAAERRPVILAAARRVCERDGVAEASMRAVAAEADIPLGTLQHVFPSRAALLYAITDDVGDEITAALRSIPVEDVGVAATLRAGLTILWERTITTGTGLLQHELALAVRHTESLRGCVASQHGRHLDLLARRFRETAEAAGETLAVDYEKLAAVTLAAVDGLILQHDIAPDRTAATLKDVASALSALAAPNGHHSSGE